MRRSGNGAAPQRSTEQVAGELRHRLEDRLGHDRTEAIWSDPANVQQVLRDEAEAASVAGMILQAWKDLPEEEPSGGRRPRRSGFRRGLQVALIAANAVWAASILRRAGQGPQGG